jgi:hypothetical protein
MLSPFREIAKLAALTLMRLSEIRFFGASMSTWIREWSGPASKGSARAVMLSETARKLLQGSSRAT